MSYDWPALRLSVSFTSAISNARREVSYENTLRDAALRTRKTSRGLSAHLIMPGLGAREVMR